MANFVYIVKTGSIKSFFEKIISLGVPEKITTKWLESIGLKSTNDRAIITLLKALKFIDNSGTPTDTYKQYRNSSLSKIIMSKAIKEYYSSLFKVYPNANEKDIEALNNFFRSHTNVGEKALTLMTATFRALCGLGDFKSEIKIPETIKEDGKLETDIEVNNQGGMQKKNVTINLNVQLTLPETENEEIYNKLFKSMKQNLLDE
ncbi:DUF5343 domain-containing protein [Candidatus Pacearchaeota archaeon]|nr:DUF5343 domain-containing protein [Candidatus Pacearchaeota archaeon]